MSVNNAKILKILWNWVSQYYEIDYFGPVAINVGRKYEKRHDVIFTCMSMRTIRIELAYDLSCNLFMDVFRQFGWEKKFFSKNGSNFKKADKEIQNALHSWF